MGVKGEPDYSPGITISGDAVNGLNELSQR
jgi:hypothetical protein